MKEKLMNIVKAAAKPNNTNVFMTKVFVPLRRTVGEYSWGLKAQKPWEIEFVAEDWVTGKDVYKLKIILNHDVEEETTDTFVFLYNDKGKRVFRTIFINKLPQFVNKNIHTIMKNPDLWVGKPDKLQ